MRDIVLGTRGSKLALAQTSFIKKELKNIGVTCTVKKIKTEGDKVQDIGFDKMEGKGFFTKEIEDALLSGAIDLAVHSHKDLETTPPAGLKISCVSERANPRSFSCPTAICWCVDDPCLTDL